MLNEVDLSPADQAAAMELLRAVRQVFKAGCVNLRDDQRAGILAALKADCPLTMTVQLLPTVHIEVSCEMQDGSPYPMFSFAVPPAQPMDFGAAIN